MLTVEAGGESLQLLPDKAVFLPQWSTLLAADVHVGKAATFRRLGVPVPRGTTTATLQRLGRLVESTGAQRLVLLGDFLHSRHAHAPATQEAVARWREAHASLQVVLVRGNHDERAGDPPAALRIQAVDEPCQLGGLALCHHPRPVEGAYALGGHLHPGIVVGRGLDRLRLPCFWLRESHGVLPAFGDFTGLHSVRPAPGDRVYACADGRVVDVTGNAGR